MSRHEKREPYVVFAVVPDATVAGGYVAMWCTYLGEIKTWFVEADDELDAYVKAGEYLINRRSKRHDGHKR